MVFIALPALQRNQRDTQRKQDMSRLKDAVERYKVNNRGQLPVFPSENNDIMELEFARSYLQVDKGEFQDPGGNNYMLRMNSDKPTYIGAGGPGAFDQKIYIFTEAKCNGWRLVNTEGVNRYAIQIKLEGGGVYCLDG